MNLDIPIAEVFVPLTEPARYKAAHGGRASAKSHFFADLVIIYSMRQRCDIICIREIQQSINQSVKKLIEKKIEQHGLGKHFKILDTHIENINGGRIGFQGMQNHTAESIKSLEGYLVAWVEEAQSLSQRSLDLLRPTIRAPGSEIWFSWNPNKPDDPVDAFFRGEQVPNRAIIVEANYRDNPWLPQEMKDEMQEDLRRDPDKYAHIWLGTYWQRNSARVFKNWTVKEFTRPETTIFRLGADWGFSVDPTVMVRCSVEGKTLFVDYEAYEVGREIDETPDLFLTIPGAEKWPSVADSSNPQSISYLQKHGFPKMAAAVKGKGSIEEGVIFLQSMDIVVHPRCKHVIDELSTYSYKIDKDTEKVLPILEDKRNHTIDALRYACEGVRRARTSEKKKTVTESMMEYVGGAGWMG